MKTNMKLNSEEIHQRLLILTRQERKIVAEIIEHLQFVSDQKLFLDFKRSSLLEYCIKDLGYSESAAIRRIKALKLARSVPQILDSLKKGELTLSQAADAQSLFEKQSQEKRKALPVEKKLELLADIKGVGARESENILREALNLPKKPRKIVIEASDEIFKKWIEFKGRLINKNWSDEKLLSYLLEKELIGNQSIVPTKKQQCALATRPSKNQRYVSANLRREVFAKNSHCQWPGCSSMYGLEIDHIRPIKENGHSVPENLRLLCKNHNIRANY